MKKFIVFVLLAGYFFSVQATAAGKDPNAQKLIAILKKSIPYCEDQAGQKITEKSLQVERLWKNNVCRTAIVNNGANTICINNIVLFEINGSGLDSNSQVYGEGFQMLTQVGGTLRQPVKLGGYTDEGHYKLVGPHNMPTAYGLFNVTLPDNQYMVLGFSTCQKFIGRISFNAQKIMVSIDAENLQLKPGQRLQMEDFMALTGSDKNMLYDELTNQISKTHPPLFGKQVPVGWCSWYCYGPDVTQKDIQENLQKLLFHL